MKSLFLSREEIWHYFDSPSLVSKFSKYLPNGASFPSLPQKRRTVSLGSLGYWVDGFGGLTLLSHISVFSPEDWAQLTAPVLGSSFMRVNATAHMRHPGQPQVPAVSRGCCCCLDTLPSHRLPHTGTLSSELFSLSVSGTCSL